MKRVLLSCLFLAGLTGPPAVAEDLRAQATFYIETYGLVDAKNHPYAKRATRVFEKIRQVAEEPLTLTPSLRIINSDGKPWALALPDGYIILSKAALDICYDRVDTETGDARLAFVIGHELAHLTANDFWHRNIYLSLSGEHNDVSLNKIKHEILRNARSQGNHEDDWRKIVKTKELQADDAGFLYASLAGFRTDKIFSDNEDSEAFLQTWVRQTRTFDDDLHYKADERTAFLRNRFRLITSQVEYFMAGVRLSHFGRYEDALHFFEKFQNAFPAHEVLNNLGYVHIQLARKYMPDSIHYQYWFPTLLENVPEFVYRLRSFESTLPPISQRHLRRAVKYLGKAAKSHSKNLASYMNLATAHFYLGEYHKARAAIEEARHIQGGSPAVNEMRSIILYEQEKDIDMWPVAVKKMSDLADPRNPTTWFNLARLYENRGRAAEASTYWKALLKQNAQLPKPVFQIACKHAASPRCKKPYKKAIPKPPFQTRIKIGTDIEHPKAKKRFKNWHHRREKIGPLPVDLLVSERGDLYIAVDYRIAMVVVKNHSYDTKKELLQRCGQPQSIRPLGMAEVWSYGPKWSVLVDQGEVREFWIKDS